MNILDKFFIFLINFYQKFFSFVLKWSLGYSLFQPVCKYEISCSQFAKESILRHGLFKGLKLSFKRFLSCHF